MTPEVWPEQLEGPMDCMGRGWLEIWRVDGGLHSGYARFEMLDTSGLFPSGTSSLLASLAPVTQAQVPGGVQSFCTGQVCTCV